MHATVCLIVCAFATVRGSRAADVVFEDAQWSALHSRLIGMSAHVHDLLDSLKAELDVEDE